MNSVGGDDGERKVESAFRKGLIAKAAAAVLEVVAASAKEKFREQEDVLAEALSDTGLAATRAMIEKQVEPQPLRVLIDGEPHGKATGDDSGTSCRIGTPYGGLSIPRALYEPENERPDGDDEKHKTIGLLEKRIGAINGLTPRMAEIVAFSDAIAPSREIERLLGLAGVRGPKRAGLERKAGLIGSDMATKAEELLTEVRSAETLPAGAAIVTIGMDRINLAYEEPNPGGEKSERTKRLRETKPYRRPEPGPITREFRGDFVGSVSIRDEHGELVGSYSHGLSHTEDPRELADALVADVVECLRKNSNLKISVCQDGARELWPIIWEAIARRDELKDVQIRACVDFYHLRPRTQAVAKLLWDDKECEQWEQRLLNEPGAILALENAMLQEVDRQREALSDDQVNAIHALQTYIEERTRSDSREDRRSELFDYAGIRAAGLPIGSGPTEATGKSLVAVRMKRSGHRWGIEGARATLTTRGLVLSSGRWELIWPRLEATHTAKIIPLPANATRRPMNPLREAA